MSCGQRSPKENAMADTITRILVPVDFSEASERALRYATNIAARLDSGIELLHVVEDPFLTGKWRAEAFGPEIPELLDVQKVDASHRLSELKAAVQNAGVSVEATVLTGRPASAIVERASAGAFDLIIMGTHGRNGLALRFGGSVWAHVIRMAPCPTLTVPGGDGGRR
jgi:universal stress protein A